MDSDKEYLNWISSLKDRIRSVQIKAAIAVNDELINLYWEIGKSIVEKQEQNRWGAKIIEQVSKDLRRELPDKNGFSRTNLFKMRQFYLFYVKSQIVHHHGGQLKTQELVQHPVGQLSSTEIVQQTAGIFATMKN